MSLDLRHSFTTRFIYSCISSKFFHGDHTVDDLLAELSMEGQRLFNEGLQVSHLPINFFALYTGRFHPAQHPTQLTQDSLPLLPPRLANIASAWFALAPKEIGCGCGKYPYWIGLRVVQAGWEKSIFQFAHGLLKKRIHHFRGVLTHQCESCFKKCWKTAKAFHMKVGFNCVRKCHLCSSVVSWF